MEYLYDEWNQIQYLTSISNIELLKKLIHEKSNITSNNSKALPNSTPLQIAIKQDNKELIELLLPISDVNQQDNFGFTALHYATLKRSKTSVALLLSNNASVLLSTKSGTTSLDIAKELQYSEIVDLLESRKRLEDDPHIPKFIEWLKFLGCKEYLFEFIKAGYDLPFIAKFGLEDEDLDCIGIPASKVGLRRKLKLKYKIDDYYDEEEDNDEEDEESEVEDVENEEVEDI